MRVIRSADYRVQPWKNGGGTTTEIVAYPPGASFEAFEWRISMAQVDEPGPFSQFPGIDRTLAVLEGAGLMLHIEERGGVRLGRPTPPYGFPGELEIESTLAEGPILDLNVMTRRGRWRHHLVHIAAIARFGLVRRGAITLMLMRGSTATAGALRLEHNDSLLLDDDAPQTLDFEIEGAADLYIVDLWPLA
jgi:hypothetical protein